MSTTTDGKIFFGVPFEEGFEFPWNDFEGIEAWWEDEWSFTPTVNPWDKEGNRTADYTDEKISQYFTEKRKFHADRPIPVVDVNYCSGEYPMIALAVPGSVKSASRGCPTAFDPGELVVDVVAKAAFFDFCTEYSIVPPQPPQWFLASYWG